MYFDPVGDAPPLAADDLVTIFEDVATTIPAAVLLGNDTDIDRDVLEIVNVFVEFGFEGTVAFDGNGDIVFTPALNSNGDTRFSYEVTDNADGSDLAVVDIKIIPVNDAPEAAADTGSTSLDVPLILRISDLLANDSDVDRICAG